MYVPTALGVERRGDRDTGNEFLSHARNQQNTDTIVSLRINQANGMLTPMGQIIKTSSPCTTVFAGV